MKKITGILALALACGSTAMSQKLNIDNVRTIYHRATGPIMANEEIKGYFTLYQSDKVDKKTNEYTLQIIDENLNKVKDVKFEDSKSIQLMESGYNGTDLIFYYFDEDQKLLDFRVYDLQGKKKFNYQREIDKKTKKWIKITADQVSNGYGNNSIFAVEGKGFLSVIPLREDGDYSYEVNYYGSQKKAQWTYNPDESIKVAEAVYLGSTDSLAVFSLKKRDNVFSKKFESSLMGLYLHNGKKAFEFTTDQKKFNFVPTNISTIKGANSFALMGPYFDKEDNVGKAKSIGLGVWEVSGQGKVLNEKYNSWENEIGKHLTVNAKGRVDELGYVYFHNIMQTSDGKFFAVGEGYKRVASGAGIALKALQGLGGGISTSSVTKIKVTDMLVLQFDPKFNVTGATIYDKNSNSVELLPGQDFTNITFLGHLVKYFFGGFDYSFTQTDKDHTSFSIGYTDYERTKDFKGLTFNAISYYGGKMSTDKINLSTKASSMSIFPAKPGSIMIKEYFKKEKRMEFRMEKIN